MIPPITRKEKYMYEIVGAGKTAPEKPLTRKEIFYAVILGEDRTVPRPITNEEKYLAAFLAAEGGQQVSVPEPVTRKEKFLYALSHKDYQPPKPITREEKFMSEVIEYIRTHGGTVTHTVSYYNYDGTELLYSETVVDGEDAAGYEGVIPVWEQPDSTNPYMKGDKVHYPTADDDIYESVVDNNVRSPVDYPDGWKIVEG